MGVPARAAVVSHGAGFRVQYMAETGRVDLPLGTAWSRRFESARPIRSLMSLKGQANFSGLYYAATMGTHGGFESWLEPDWAMEMDFDLCVTRFSSQPIP